MRRDRAGNLKEDPGVGPLPQLREPAPEQRTDCEDLPDSDNIQRKLDIRWSGRPVQQRESAQGP